MQYKMLCTIVIKCPKMLFTRMDPRMGILTQG